MTVALYLIGPGNQGIEQTVGEIWRHILSYSPVTRQVAESILREAHVQHSPNYLRARALYYWVQRHLAYTGDHVLVEELRGAVTLLQDIEDHRWAFGDCDDYVILLGALLAAIGIPFNLALVSARPDQEFDHIFLILFTELGPEAADAIPPGPGMPGHPFGWHVPLDQVTHSVEYQMPQSLEELGFSTVEALTTRMH
jgi:hypothetical protein